MLIYLVIRQIERSKQLLEDKKGPDYQNLVRARKLDPESVALRLSIRKKMGVKVAYAFDY